MADIIFSFQLLVKSELNEMKLLRRKFIYEIIDIKKGGLDVYIPKSNIVNSRGKLHSDTSVRKNEMGYGENRVDAVNTKLIPPHSSFLCQCNAT